MKFSTLQLKHSHFTALSIVAREDIQPEHLGSVRPYPELAEADLKTHVQLGTPDDNPDPHEFMVILAIHCDPDSNSMIPYRFTARMEGVFEIEHDGPLEERTRLVVINGAGILFGTIREQILALTGRHKHGPLMLPSLDFRSLSPGTAPAPEQAASKPRRKPKTVAKK